MRERGLREQKKAEKESAIREAAASLFRERGFDATTTQAVAERAGVAKGTVFLYAPTKVDLVAMVFVDRVRRAAEQALAAAPEASLVDDLDAIFARFFAMYSKEKELARIFVKELAFVSGPAARMRDEVDVLFGSGLAARIEARKARGEVREDVPAMLAAVSVFALYLTALMSWLAREGTSVAAARAHLRASLELLVRGLAPARAEEGSSWQAPQQQAPQQQAPQQAPQQQAPPRSTKARSRSVKRGSATSTRGASETAATKRRGSS